MKRILFICNRLGGGGSERVLTILANALSMDKDNDVHIISLTQTTDKYVIDNHVKVDEQKEKITNSFEAIRALIKTIRFFCPNTIISFEYQINLKAILAAKLSRYKGKIIVSERNDPHQRGGRFPLKQLRDVLYNLVDCLVCQTPDAKAYFKNGVQKKTVVIPNPIKGELPAPWNGPREHVIVNFCRLVKQKNIPLLIDAFEIFYQKHQDYKLVIYGDGEEFENITKYITNKNMNSIIKIKPSAADVHFRILKASMFVSSSDFEGLSNSMLEAMALGIPTICTDCPCGGARMVIQNKANGILVPVGNINELADAMAYVADSDNVKTKLSEGGRKIKDIFSNERIIGQWEKII